MLQNQLQYSSPRTSPPSIVAAFAITAALLSSCGAFARLGIGTTSISKIEAAPSEHGTVYIRGKVIDQVGLFGVGAYEVKDRSGSMWVITEAGLPAHNSTVTVRGTAQEGLSLGSRTFGVTLDEIERL